MPMTTATTANGTKVETCPVRSTITVITYPNGYTATLAPLPFGLLYAYTVDAPSGESLGTYTATSNAQALEGVGVLISLANDLGNADAVNIFNER